jgi:flagellar basal body-associated protein FliL
MSRLPHGGEVTMFDGWFSIMIIVLVGIFVSAVFASFAWLISPKNRRARRAEQRRKDRIDLTSGVER